MNYFYEVGKSASINNPKTQLVAKANNFADFNSWAAKIVESGISDVVDIDSDNDISWFANYLNTPKERRADESPFNSKICREVYDELKVQK